MKNGSSPLRRGPFLFLRAPSALRNRPLPEQRVHFSSSYSFSGKTPLFPLRYAVKQKQYGIFRAQPLRFPHAQPQGEAGLSGRTPAFHTTGGRNAPCRKHKKKDGPGKDRPRFFRGRTPLFGVFPQHINHLLLRADHAGVDEFLDIGIGLQNGFGGILGFAVPGVEPDDEAAGVIRIERVVAAG